MSTLVKLRGRAQITLPIETVKELNLKEGDNLSVTVDNGKVVITPVAVIPKDELWAWAHKVRSAIEEGKLKEYDTVEELWKDMQVAED